MRRLRHERANESAAIRSRRRAPRPDDFGPYDALPDDELEKGSHVF